MKRSRRDQTIHALIVGSRIPAVAVGPIPQELSLYLKCSKIKLTPNSARLYKIFHMSRTVDSAVSLTVQHFGEPAPYSLGNGLISLAKIDRAISGIADPSSLTRHHNNANPKSLTSIRNRYVHQAGALPASEQELGDFLSLCETVLSAIL